MKNMKAQRKFSNMHLFFPKVIAVILLILGVALIIQRARACKKTGTPSSVCTGFSSDYMLWIVASSARMISSSGMLGTPCGACCGKNGT